MQRKAMVIGIKPECIEEYKKYHSDPWPEVLECIAKGNVKIFQYLFMVQFCLVILNIMETT